MTTPPPAPYTPTDEEVRNAVGYRYQEVAPSGMNLANFARGQAMFDAWLAAHDADRDRLAKIVDEVRALCDAKDFRCGCFYSDCSCHDIDPNALRAILSGEGK